MLSYKRRAVTTSQQKNGGLDTRETINATLKCATCLKKLKEDGKIPYTGGTRIYTRK